jgi:hypothetical protein
VHAHQVAVWDSVGIASKPAIPPALDGFFRLPFFSACLLSVDIFVIMIVLVPRQDKERRFGILG